MATYTHTVHDLPSSSIGVIPPPVSHTNEDWAKNKQNIDYSLSFSPWQKKQGFLVGIGVDLENVIGEKLLGALLDFTVAIECCAEGRGR